MKIRPIAIAASLAIAPSLLFAAYERSEDFTPLSSGPRARVAPKTYFFAEFLTQYSMHHDFLRQWIDRPLFSDRGLRPADNHFTYQTKESFAIHAREAARMGLDGFNFLPIGGRLKEFLRYREWADELGLKDYSSLYAIGYGEDSIKHANTDYFLEVISSSRKNPKAPRILGKVLVPTYNHGMYGFDEHRAFNEVLRKNIGDDFLLCGDLPYAVMARLKDAYKAKGTLSAAESAELEASVRKVLDVSGGVQISAPMYRRPPEGPYCSRPDFTFFDKHVVPVLEKVMSEERYRDKIIGSYLRLGYINPKSADCDAEDGTSTLRQHLRSMARLNPDFLMCFEWNEQEENTMFQPTVYGGSVIGRLLRYHVRFFAGKGPDVYPGDDPSVPPLTLSYRLTARIGEEVGFEILNIPDGAYSDMMNVRLHLFDMDGREVEAFPMETIDPRRYGAITYRCSTADLVAGDAYYPVLEVGSKRYSGFTPLRIDSSVSYNYKAVRHSLRDLAKAEVAAASVEDKGGGFVGYDFRANFGESVASVELMADEVEQGALGNEFDGVSNHIVRVVYTAACEGVGGKSFGVKVRGAKDWQVKPIYAPQVDSGNPKVNPETGGYMVHGLWVWKEQLAHVLVLPKSTTDSSCVLEISASPGKTVEIPLASVLSNGVVSASLDDTRAFRVEVTKQTVLADHPRKLGLSSVAWSGVTECSRRYPVFHFRVVTESGKIWRSRPMRAGEVPLEAKECPIFDEFVGKPAKRSIRVALLPRIDYRFSPSTGAALSSGWTPEFDAQLGGGVEYCNAYYDGRLKVVPGCRVPEWVLDDGRDCLRFDGVNDYVHLPRETLPQAAFSLGFEIKPELADAKGPMVLFRHFNWIRGSISLFIRNGELVATWGDRDLKREPVFHTGLMIKDGEWNRIAVSYDFERFVFRVNGANKEIPWVGRAWGFRPSVFGGHDKAELSPYGEKPVYYKGLLRRLVIRH